MPLYTRLIASGERLWRWLAQHISIDPAAAQRRWYVWQPAWLLVGIAGYFALPIEPPLWSGGLLSCLLLAGRLSLGEQMAPRWAALARPMLSALLLVALGLTAGMVRTSMVTSPVLLRETGPVLVRGAIGQIEQQGKRYRLTIEHPAIDTLAADQIPARIRISGGAIWRMASPGMTISVRAILRPPPGPSYAGGYDFRRDLFYRRIGAVGFALGGPKVLAPPQTSFWSGIETLRQAVNQRIAATLAGETGAVARALLTGDRGGISEATYDQIRKAGIAHLLAISGLHLGIVAGWVFALIRLLLAMPPRLTLRWPGKKLAALGALVAVSGYTLLAGAPVPTLRAWIMIALGIVAIWRDRDPFSLRLVGIAAIILMLAMPETVPGPSFEMSFAAVAALIVSYQAFKRRGWLFGANPAADAAGWPGERLLTRLARGFLAICFTTIVASLATAPFAMLHFQQVATFGLVGNLVGVPLASLLVIPGGFLSLCLMPVGLESLPLQVMGWGIDQMLSVARDIAAMPAASMQTMPLVAGSLLTLVMLALMVLAGFVTPLLGLLGLMGCLWLLPFSQPLPVLLASDDGDLVGIPVMRDGKRTLLLTQTRRDSFTAEAWQRYLATTETAQLGHGRQSQRPELLCDGDGCRLLWQQRGNGATDNRPPMIAASITIARTHGAMTEDCGGSDLILIPGSGWLRCARSQVIDHGDLRRQNGISVFMRGGKLVVIGVNEQAGRRPWTHPWMEVRDQ